MLSVLSQEMETASWNINEIFWYRKRIYGKGKYPVLNFGDAKLGEQVTCFCMNGGWF